MNIQLKPQIAKLLAAQVAAGRFASVEDAVEALALDDAATQADFETADLDWAKPYVDKGLADLDAGRTVPADEIHAELRARYGASKA